MHERFMCAALEQAQQAKGMGEIPVGAVIVHEGEIIAHAHNEREASLDPTAHAEVLAIRRAAKKLGRRRLSGCTLYVTLEPCPMCAGAIVMSEMDAVYFGAADAQAGCAGSVYAVTEDPAFGKKIPCSGFLLEEPCREILNDFFTERRG